MSRKHVWELGDDKSPVKQTKDGKLYNQMHCMWTSTATATRKRPLHMTISSSSSLRIHRFPTLDIPARVAEEVDKEFPYPPIASFLEYGSHNITSHELRVHIRVKIWWYIVIFYLFIFCRFEKLGEYIIWNVYQEYIVWI